MGTHSQLNKVREIKGIHIRKEEIKLSIFTDGMIVYEENNKEATAQK